MKRIAIGLIAAAFLAVSSAALAVDGGSGGTAVSAHNGTDVKGTCAKCHVPHGGKGDKIWAKALTTFTTFSGVHQLCNTCHYANSAFQATSGIGTGAADPLSNVFILNKYQNHSMLNWANVTHAGITMPASGFPLNTADVDTIWTLPDPDNQTVSQGFYCGTCHNPHKQPVLGGTVTTSGNGDYLRVSGTPTLAAFGGSGARDGACTQCHSGVFPTGTQVSTGHEGNCTQCHHPHKGRTLASVNTTLAEKILTISTAAINNFVAQPNVDGFTGTYANTIASVCYGCHKNTVAGGGGLPTLATQITTTNEHHPMGTDALAGAGTHAPGYTITNAGTFTCSSCHDYHNGLQDYYLRGTTGTYVGTASDDGQYCVDVCHNNKNVAAMSAATGGHLWAAGTAFTGNRGECFMCHAIHDGPARGTVARADINALMRILPLNFAAALTSQNVLVNEYEDMCYGCHGLSTITGGPGVSGAKLSENGIYSFTHLFSGTPSAFVAARMGTNYPLANTTATGGRSNNIDGYGTVTGQIYCGTCHNVHVQNTTDSDGELFRKANNYGTTTNRAVMCVDCHGSSGMSSGKTHPTYLDAGYNVTLPVAGQTDDPVPVFFGTGGDGVQGGRTGLSSAGVGPATGVMSCETCHNFHSSSTSRLGYTSEVDGAAPIAGNKGKLLITDNMDTTDPLFPAGSNLCGYCHGITLY